MRLLSNAQRTFFEQAVTRYQEDLAGDTAAQTYLASRGFGQQAASTFRLGVVRRPLVGHEHLTGRLVIPYLATPTPTGRGGGVQWMRFRCLRQHDCKEAGCAKYLPPEGFETRLFNVADLAKTANSIAVCEGELDTMSASLSGIPAVGVPGVENWKGHFARTLENFQQVFVFADGDKAGRKFASFLAKEVRARIIRMPEGGDLNDVFKQHGPAGVQGLLVETE